MKRTDVDKRARELVLQYELDAPPEKVWRALSIPEFREKWLPEADLAEAKPLSTVPGVEIRFRMRDREPPNLESIVAFQIRTETGRTILRIVHRLVDTQPARGRSPAANSNEPWVMRAA